MISPTLACADWLNLQRDIEIMDRAGVDYYHIDIMDGHYVPNLCFNLDILRALRRISATPVDVHLMVTNPMNYIERLSDLKVELACTHIDSIDEPGLFLETLRRHDMHCGLALSPEDGLDCLEPYFEYMDYVLLMFVKPGFSGQNFMPEVLDKLAALDRLRSRRGLRLMIEVDGGVGWKNAGRLIENGADILVSGAFGNLDGSREQNLADRTSAFRAVCVQKHGTRFTAHLQK